MLSLVSPPFPEPVIAVSSRAEVFLGYLDYFRSRLISKLEALPGGELRRSRQARLHAGYRTGRVPGRAVRRRPAWPVVRPSRFWS
jgi:hypothetical protein